LLGACAALPAWAAETQDAALRRFFDEDWEWDLREAPISATLLGDRRFDDRWPDLSPEAIAHGKAHLQERRKRLLAFDAKKLSEQSRLSLQLYLVLTEDAVAASHFPSERLAITQHTGPHRDLVDVAVVPRYESAKQLADYVKRLHAIPRYIDQTIALLEAGRQSGWVGAREPLRGLPASIRGIKAASPEKSAFFTPFKSTSVGAAEAKPLSDEARAVIKDAVEPAFEKLATYVEKTYLPATRNDVGAWSLPEGDAYYRAAVRAHTTTSHTPDELHAVGLSEVARIRTAMDTIIRQTGFAGSRAQWNEMLRSDPRFFYKEPAHIVSAYRDIAKRIDGMLPTLFGRLPRLPYGVMETPAHEAPTSYTAYYREGSATEGRAGMFVANTYKPETRPRWEMEALTLHEAVPGHHLQIALAQELEDLPRFRREPIFNAFVEGWGLYAESLGAALGLYADPYSKYGQLTYEMWRAVRLVVDTGMHAKHWTRQQAIDYFVENTAKSRHDIEVEIDRYIVWPGQALAYKTGELEIKRLRAYAERTLGPRFDVRRFHDVVLGAGALPLDVLDRRVRAFVEAAQTGK
jgi:prolyl oligopeptidase